MTTVYCLILNLVHLLYDLLSYVHRQWVRVKRSVTFGKNLDGVEAISSRIDNLSKVPNHIVVLFVDNEVPGADLARIISWCYAARIPHLSFYSYYGIFQDNGNCIRKELTNLHPELESKVDWNRNAIKPITNGINGVKHKIRVNFLSYSDGKGDIVNLAKKLGSLVSSGELKLKDIDVSFVDKMLQKDGIPEPDLAFICSEVTCTYGLLPWHTRVTEFFPLPTKPRLIAEDFVVLLEKYNKCEQRYGK